MLTRVFTTRGPRDGKSFRYVLDTARLFPPVPREHTPHFQAQTMLLIPCAPGSPVKPIDWDESEQQCLYRLLPGASSSVVHYYSLPMGNLYFVIPDATVSVVLCPLC